MKEGYIYLVIDNKTEDGILYHYFDIGEIVECTYSVGNESYFRNYKDAGQFMQSNHVFEIGKL